LQLIVILFDRQCLRTEPLTFGLNEHFLEAVCIRSWRPLWRHWRLFSGRCADGK